MAGGWKTPEAWRPVTDANVSRRKILRRDILRRRTFSDIEIRIKDGISIRQKYCPNPSTKPWRPLFSPMP